MLRTVTEDLDDAMEVLLQKVYFLLQRIYLVFHLKKPNNTCWMDGLLMSEELYQHFESKVGRIEVFLMFFLQNFCVDLELKQQLFFIISLKVRLTTYFRHMFPY